ncbi:hypothetical protein J7376_13175 [Paracoccus sp. R12_1]|nr:hypothetical protein [Paracoccus sp. R12_2]MBO9487478.1 hypothetical protein [Paracoccus sp. R12_1]
MTKQYILLRVAGGVARAFGLLTVVSGEATLPGGLQIGANVSFVLWFNTLAGLVYVVADLGLWQGRQWSWPLSLAIFAATLLVFAAFGLHVAQGGAFEARTVFAMTLRSTLWGGIALVARQLLTDQAFSGR